MKLAIFPFGFTLTTVFATSLSIHNYAIAANEASLPPAVVITFTAKEELQGESLQFPAEVKSLEQSEVRAESTGIVKKILAEAGQHVIAGQTLFMVQNSDDLYHYALQPIRSKTTGVLSEIRTHLGAEIGPNDKIAHVFSPSKLRTVIEVPAAEAGHIRSQKLSSIRGTLILDGQSYPVVMHSLAPSVKESTGTVTAELRFEIVQSTDLNKDLKSKHASKSIVPHLPAAGSIGHVVLSLDVRNRLMVPESAVIYRTEPEKKIPSTFVRIAEKLDDKTAKISLLKVELANNGQLREGRNEIRSGLKPGALVVERSSRFVVAGETVNLQDDKNPVKR